MLYQMFSLENILCEQKKKAQPGPYVTVRVAGRALGGVSGPRCLREGREREAENGEPELRAA